MSGNNLAARNASNLDLQRVRRDFPIFRRKIHGKPLVYLDSAASTQKPQAVIDAIERFYVSECSNVHRGLHELSMRATAEYEGARAKLQKFLGAADPRQVIFTRGTTESINLVARSYGDKFVKAGDEIVLTEMEHHSNIVPWQLLCERTGAKLRVAPINDAGELELDALERLLGPRTRMVAVVHISNALGTRNPVEKIIEMAHAHGAHVLLDGAQAVAHEPLDLAALDCDFFAMSGHKMYGPTGIGVLYGKAELLERLPPYEGGGDMIHTVTFEKTTYNELPCRLEAGTPNIAGAIGLGAAVDYLENLGLDALAAAERDLLAYGTRRLEAVPGLEIVGTAQRKSSVLSFTLDGVHPHDVGTVLDGHGVAVRAGHHCAQPLMERFGIPATVRASLGCYNVPADIDRLIEGLDQVREVFKLMADLRDLYQEMILDHGKNPRNRRELDPPCAAAQGHNPLCGDRLSVQVRVDGERIDEIAFHGAGCAISMASASMMTQALQGMTLAEADALFREFALLVRGESSQGTETTLGKLVVFGGVSEFPVRVKCATLAWHTLRAALSEDKAPISTE